MSKIVGIAIAPTSSPFSRFVATIDRLLTTGARISLRNSDLPRSGL